MRVNETTTWKFKVDGKSYVNELRIMEEKIDDLKEAQKGLEKGTKEYIDAGKQIKTMEGDYKKFRDGLDLTTLSVKQLSAFKKDLVKDINNLVPGTAEYIRRTEQLKEVNSRLQAVRDDVRGVHEEAKPSFWTNFKSILAAAFTISGITELIGQVRQFGSVAIDLAVKLTDTYGDMQKATGLSADEVEKLDKNLQKIDTRTSSDGLREMAVVAGQLGIAGEEVEGFVKGVDRVNVALGDEFTGGIEEVSKSLGGLKKIFSDTKDMKYEDALNKIGSSLNTLGATGSAKAPDIANFASRVAQLGDLAPKSAAEILGLGSGFLELNVSAEIASSGLKNVFTTAAGDIPVFSQQLGISKQKMEDLINTNPNEFLFRLAESFKGATPTQMVAQLNQLGIRSQEGQGAVMLLAKNTDFFRQRQNEANKAFVQGTSVMDEFNIKNNTSAALVDKQRKEFTLLQENIGTKLLPMYLRLFGFVNDVAIPGITTLATGFIFFGKAIFTIPEFLWEIRGALGGLALALVTLNASTIASTASTIADTAAKKAQTLWTNATAVAQGALNVVMNANPFVRVLSLVLLFVGGLVTLYQNSVTVRAGFAALWASIKAVGTELINFVKAAATLDVVAMADVLTNGAKRIMAATQKAYQDEMKKGQEEEKKLLAKHQEDKKKSSVQNANAMAQQETATRQAAAQKMLEDSKALQEELQKGSQTGQERETATHKKGNAERTAAKKEALKQQKEAEKAHLDELQDMRELYEEYEQRARVSRELAEAKTIQNITQIQMNAHNLTTLREGNLANNRLFNAQRVYEAERKAIQDSTLAADAKAKALRELDSKYFEFKKSILDSEHATFVALKNAELNKADHDAKAKLAIKKAMLDEDYKYTKQKLELEAAQERLRIEESVTDANQRAVRLKAVDDKLSADLILNASNTEAEKKRLEKEAYDARWARTSEFYDGLSAAMQGDMVTFMNYMLKRAEEDGKHLNKRAVEFAKHGQEIGTIMLTVVQELGELNEAITAKKIKELDTEKAANLAKLQAEFEAGTITQEQLDAAKLDLQNKYDLEVLELKKKEFERNKKMQIATALIQGSMAVLSALATPPFPLGLALAITAGIKTAIDIKKIKDTKFEYAKGGYVRNAGVPEGPLHGATYGESGIALLNRATGEEVGEMEGGEPILILSRNTYKNNGALINKLMESSLYKNGAPVFADGGLIDPSRVIEPLRKGQKYEFGTRTRLRTEVDASAASERSRSLSESIDIENNERNTAEMIGMAANAQAVTAENVGLTVEVLNEISAGLSRYLPEFERIMSQQISQAEMMRQILDLQNSILNRIQDNTSRAADAASQSKRNDL